MSKYKENFIEALQDYEGEPVFKCPYCKVKVKLHNGKRVCPVCGRRISLKGIARGKFGVVEFD